MEEEAVVEFVSIHSRAHHPIQLKALRAMRSECSECESTVRCTAIGSRIKRTKLSLPTESCAMRLTPKIGPQLKNGFGACFSKNPKNFGTSRNCNRFTKLIEPQLCARSWRRSLVSFLPSRLDQT